MKDLTTKQILSQIQEFTERGSKSYQTRTSGDAFYAEIKKMQDLMAEIQGSLAT